MNNSARLAFGKTSSLISSPSKSLARRNFGDIPVGKKQVQQLKNWIPTLAVFGGTAGIAGLYFTDWRVITEWIPFYSGKYKTDED